VPEDPRPLAEALKATGPAKAVAGPLATFRAVMVTPTGVFSACVEATASHTMWSITVVSMFIVKSVPHLLPLVDVISEEVPVERLVLAEL
jgi:hypothetical protein